MKIVFVSNYFNHHQKPFCEAMYRKFGNEFVFVSTTAMREERKKLGYDQHNYPHYVFLSYENDQQLECAMNLIEEADIVIAGSAPNDMLTKRIRQKKLLMRYSERPFKKKISIVRKAYHFFNLRRKNLFKKKVYMLCASAYATNDYVKIGMYKNFAFKWGYFPEFKKQDLEVLFSQKQPTMIMWCGRFIDWKHPDDAIRIAKRLKDNGYVFCLNMIGTGVMEEELHQLSKKLGVDDVVRFLGSMSPDQVRIYMEKAGIYLFTSDRKEGWGAVLNESMNSGCAVVASHAIGAVPYLVKNGQNGLIYKSGDIDMLYQKVKYLLDNPEIQRQLGTFAYETIAQTWNAEVAAERLIVLAQHILDGNDFPDIYADGPCSRAELIADDWFKKDDN